MENSELKTRKTTEIEKEVCEYLNDLRESGVTNMFGAGPYVEQNFSVSKREAREYVSLWMANFNDECNYETVKL
jgi:hypothetical protein